MSFCKADIQIAIKKKVKASPKNRSIKTEANGKLNRTSLPPLKRLTIAAKKNIALKTYATNLNFLNLDNSNIEDLPKNNFQLALEATTNH